MALAEPRFAARLIVILLNALHPKCDPPGLTTTRLPGRGLSRVQRVTEEGALLSVMTLKSLVRRLVADGQTDISVGQACRPVCRTEIRVERRECRGRRGQRTTRQMRSSKSHIVDFAQVSEPMGFKLFQPTVRRG
jgi:hypothetical protein